MDQELLKQKLKGCLRFSSMAEAEKSIKAIHELYEACLREKDFKSAFLCKQRIMEGKNRANKIANNKSVSPLKRKEKREIYLWFNVWLENPGLFEKWLKLRKESHQFKAFLNEIENQR